MCETAVARAAAAVTHSTARPNSKMSVARSDNVQKVMFVDARILVEPRFFVDDLRSAPLAMQTRLGTGEHEQRIFSIFEDNVDDLDDTLYDSYDEENCVWQYALRVCKDAAKELSFPASFHIDFVVFLGV